MGYLTWIGTFEGDTNPEKVHHVESQIVTEFLSLGAIIYCKVQSVASKSTLYNLLT